MSDWYPELLEPFTDLDEARRTKPERLHVYGVGRKGAMDTTSPEQFAKEFSQVREVHLRRPVVIGAIKKLPHLEQFTMDWSPFPDPALLEICQLPTLRHLRLWNAHEGLVTDEPYLTPEFYELISKQSHIESLELLYCDYDLDEDLRVLSGSTSIRSLKIVDPYAGPEGLEALGAMKQLEELTVHHADITPEVIEAWSSLPRLRKLDLFNREVELNIPLQPLTKLSDMTSFRVWGKLSCSEQELRQCLKHWPRLENFALDGRDTGPALSDDFLGQLSDLPNLKSVRLRGGDFSWSGIALLSKLEHLSALDLKANAHQSDRGADKELRFAGVKHLNLAFSRMSSRGLDAVAAFPGLETLRLESTAVDAQVCGHIAGMTHLKYLNLADCELVNDESLEQIAALAEIEFLDLSGSKLITDKGLKRVSRLSHLKCLDLKGCSQITDEGIAHLVNLSHLEDLDLGDCELLTDRSIEYLSAIPGIASLGLLGCDQMTEAGLLRLAEWRNLGHFGQPCDSEKVSEVLDAVHNRFHCESAIEDGPGRDPSSKRTQGYPLRGRIN